MNNSQRITNYSRRIRKICSGLIFCFPLFVLCYWLFFDNQIIRTIRPLPIPVIHELPNIYRLWALLIEMLPLSVIIYGFLKLKKLFQLYENGMIFTKNNVDSLKRLGWTLIIWAICDVIKNTLLCIILPLDPFSPVHYTPLHIAYLTCIFVGIFILVISWVMDEAREIHDEQSLII